MMAPNPHWWAEKPELYDYTGYSYATFWSHIPFWICIFIREWTKSDWWMGLAVIFLLGGLLIWVHWGDRDGQRIETRFNHMTLRRGSDVLEHEDMREIVSLEPVMHRFSGRLNYDLATFSTGRSIRIYHNLRHREALIERLRGYLGISSLHNEMD